MSTPNDHLSIVNEAINVPGVAWKRNAVLFSEQQKVETLNKLASAALEVSGGAAWWLGDIGLALQEQKGAHYITGRAEVLGVDEGYWMNCVSLCRFFKPSQRCETLTVHHHAVAMKAAGGASGDIKTATRWLTMAAESGWSAAELRKHVNLSLASAPKPKNDALENPFAPVDEADKWATQHKADTTSPQHAAQLLTRWQALVEYIELLREKAREAA